MIDSFLFIKIFGTVALWFGIRFSASKMRRMIFWDLFAILVLSFALGHFGSTRPFLGGIVGYEMNDYLQDYIAIGDDGAGKGFLAEEELLGLISKEEL